MNIALIFIYIQQNNPMSIIKGDSLLSNLSNISFLLKPGSGSSIFNLPMHNNSNQDDNHNNSCQVKIQDIFPGEEHILDNNSILDNIIKREDKEGSILHFYQTPIMPQVMFKSAPEKDRGWRITKQQGVSEDQNSESKMEYQRQEKQQDDDKQQVNQKKLKNQTKNIPKNYGKAIISFIQKYRDKVRQVCQYTGVPYEAFYDEMMFLKKTINTIADLRRLWIDYKYAKCMRIVSNLFFRKYSLNYIFNSRICNFRSHIKYRHRLSEAICNPKAFRHIKDY